MVTREKRYTLDDLRAVEDRPENADKSFELLNGEIYEMPGASPLHNFIVAQIVYFLMGFVRPQNIGFVFGDATSYTLPNGDELIPDASFVSKEQVALPFPEKFLFAPDLAIEVASPSNRERELLDKTESYLQSGTRVVWIVYLPHIVVDVCHLDEDGELKIRKVEISGTLDGEDVLPGFKLAVKDIFPVE
ncbi:MAG: Uma2 family endonuclease [Anaerolineae bacterium]|nr:Uma2 family endonuclease [Anaerolineae bacterium]